MDSFSLKKIQFKKAEKKDCGSRGEKVKKVAQPGGGTDFLKRVNRMKKATDLYNKENIDTQSQFNHIKQDQPINLRIGSPGQRRIQNFDLKAKSPDVRTYNFFMDMQKVGASKQIRAVEQVKIMLNRSIKEQKDQYKGVSENVNLSNLLPFQKRARSKSPPIVFGQANPQSAYKGKLKLKAVVLQDLGTQSSESTQGSSRLGTLDFNKNSMSNQLKDFINNKLDSFESPNQNIQEMKLLDILNGKDNDKNNSDKELDQWFKGQEVNPFAMASDDFDFDSLRDSLPSQRSDKSRDSDWLYKTKGFR